MKPCVTNPDLFYSSSRKGIAAAVEHCLTCPVMIQCRDTARRLGDTHGVWGGETADERKRWWAGNRPTLLDEVMEQMVKKDLRSSAHVGNEKDKESAA